jgi:two-component system chemotaxis response regulator CheB
MSDHTTNSRIRDVVADDSAMMRTILAEAVIAAGMDVVGRCADGAEAIRACELHRPDVLTLDLSMPGVDGVKVLRSLAGTGLDVRVLVVSAFGPDAGATAVEVLAEGASDLVVKPAGDIPLSVFLADLTDRVSVLGSAVPVRASDSPTRPRTGARSDVRTIAVAAGGRVSGVLAIAASTGGPRALKQLLAQIPAVEGGAVIVQHMPAGFTAPLAQRLNGCSALTVREATPGAQLSPDTVLLAPSGAHLRFGSTGRCYLSSAPPKLGVRPCADLALKDLAAIHGDRLTAAVLTGMGSDGVEGARAVRDHGGIVVAQAAEGCTVFGMSRRVIEAGVADYVQPLDGMAGALATASQRTSRRRRRAG